MKTSRRNMKLASIIIIVLAFCAIEAKKYLNIQVSFSQAYKLSHIEPTGIKYQYDLAILNKSFVRDVDRSVNLYKSFEEYFVGAEHTPFFIVIPACDLELFTKKFNDAKNEKEIKTLPTFFIEQDILQRCKEPDMHKGSVNQQLIKLCFGTLEIAKNYISLDSDNYFTKRFNPTTLFTNGVIKTASWKLNDIYIEQFNTNVVGFTDATELTNTWLNNMKFIKNFFGNHNNPKDYYSFVNSSLFISSDSIHRMKKFLADAGIYDFAHLLAIIPFEGQWYGEYVLYKENFIASNGLFTLINSPNDCALEDGGDKAYGVWFQSLDYDYESNRRNPESTLNPNLVYKRPAHCDNKPLDLK
jgi:hypothetical protein